MSARRCCGTPSALAARWTPPQPSARSAGGGGAGKPEGRSVRPQGRAREEVHFALLRVFCARCLNVNVLFCYTWPPHALLFACASGAARNQAEETTWTGFAQALPQALMCRRRNSLMSFSLNSPSAQTVRFWKSGSLTRADSGFRGNECHGQGRGSPRIPRRGS